MIDPETQNMIDEDRKAYWTPERIIAAWSVFLLVVAVVVAIVWLFGYLTIGIPVEWTNDVRNGITDCHKLFGLMLCK